MNINDMTIFSDSSLLCYIWITMFVTNNVKISLSGVYIEMNMSDCVNLVILILCSIFYKKNTLRHVTMNCIQTIERNVSNNR